MSIPLVSKQLQRDLFFTLGLCKARFHLNLQEYHSFPRVSTPLLPSSLISQKRTPGLKEEKRVHFHPLPHIDKGFSSCCWCAALGTVLTLGSILVRNGTDVPPGAGEHGTEGDCGRSSVHGGGLFHPGLGAGCAFLSRPAGGTAPHPPVCLSEPPAQGTFATSTSRSQSPRAP